MFFQGDIDEKGNEGTQPGSIEHGAIMIDDTCGFHDQHCHWLPGVYGPFAFGRPAGAAGGSGGHPEYPVYGSLRIRIVIH